VNLPTKGKFQEFERLVGKEKFLKREGLL
jgi:hypothetical protein